MGHAAKLSGLIMALESTPASSMPDVVAEIALKRSLPQFVAVHASDH